MSDSPDTVVLIHGLWMTPLSWEGWAARFGAAGYTVLTPAWPGVDGDIEDVRRDPSRLRGLGVREITDSYARIISELPKPPIVMGHSFGGAVTQLLLDRGLGAAGVAVDPAPVKGVLSLPISALRVAFPAVRNPFGANSVVELSPKQFHYAFGNALSFEESEKVRQRYAIPGPARPLLQAAFANGNPKAATKVDFRKPGRAPLLIIGGGSDHVVPPAITRETAKRYHKGPSPVEYHEFHGRTHYIVGQDGWEEVADYALTWAAAKTAGPPAGSPPAGD
jgi:pimeloyl-ACP methyl ester carboxylesterase